jgi:uncharacterized protein (DUF427 family)
VVTRDFGPAYGYPKRIVPVGHVEPVPRRIRAIVGGQVVLDTVQALYVWESSRYPQYYVPLADVDTTVLHDEEQVEVSELGSARRHSLRVDLAGRDTAASRQVEGVGSIVCPGAALVFTEGGVVDLTGMVRFTWSAMDTWLEEDEPVFVHPRDPYTRVDAIRSSRHVTVELEGEVLAESGSPVMVFETGLPPRYYLDRPAVNFEHLDRSNTETACPYKGVTSDYWSARVASRIHEDIAWSYGFPTRELMPIAGLVAFYNERVDMIVDGQLLERPVTSFSPAS